MAAPAATVSLYLPTSTAITAYTTSAVVDRGRTSPLFDDFAVGTASAVLNNETRLFDPLYSAGTHFGDLVPGRRFILQCTPSGGSAITIFDGTVDDYGLDYPNPKKSNTVIQAVDDLAELGRARFDEWTTTYGDYAGDRLTAALARPEVNYGGTTSFDTGVTALTSDLVTWGSNVLNYCQLVARTDFGYFFATRSNAIVFYGRLHFINSSSAATFGTGGIGFESIGVTYGKEQLFNYVQVGRIAGPYDEEDPEPQTATDSASVTAYKLATLNFDGLLHQSDAQGLGLAEHLLDVYKDPLYRFASLRINVHGLSTAQQTTVLGLDIGSVVTVTFTPNGVGSAITRTCIIDGMRHTILPSQHVLELALNDSGIVQTGNYFEPNSGTYGAFSGSTMSYPFPS